MKGHRSRVAVWLILGVLLASCAASSPTATASASASPPASASSPASGQAQAPAACLDAKFAYADSLGVLLLAGCFDQLDTGSVEPLWAWDGAAWELVEDDGPPATVVSGMAWDAERDVLVRYGGIPLPSQECSTETWEWDTDAWQLVEAEPPEPCDHHELAWDAPAARMLVVGGGRGQNLTTGTSAWDGTAWSRVAETGPGPRAHHGVRRRCGGGSSPAVRRLRRERGVRRSLGVGRIGLGGAHRRR